MRIIIGGGLESVGIVGLGKMGAGIAENLLKAGFLKAVYRRTLESEEIKRFAERGVYVAKSPADLARHMDLVILSVPHDAVYEVIFGDEGVVKGMKPKGVIVDTGNCDPRQSKKIHNGLKEYNIDFLDVGVSGGPERAKRADLAVWVGGDKEIYERLLPIFQAIGKPRYIGPSGSGHTIKMLHNVMEQIEMQGIAEVANFARNLKFDPRNVFKTIRDGLVQSHLSDIYSNIPESEITSREPKVEGGDYPRMALEIAKETGDSIVGTAVSYWIRAISRAPEEEKEKIIEDATKAIGEELRKLKNREKFKYGFQCLGAIRKAFGGHK